MLPALAFSLSALVVSAVYADPSPRVRRGGTGKVASAWYAGWHATEGFPLSDVSWEKYTELIYSFAITTPDVKNISLSGSDPTLLPQFVAEAHRNNVKAEISIGGWTGSQYYSSNIGSPANRTAFVKTVTDFVTYYELDGVNFDWEYPNHQGIGCNVINANDSTNFLSFLQELRENPVGSKLILSAATSVTPFVGPDGTPLTDVSGFSQVLDYVAVMNYDIWGSWSTAVGPNSPLNDTCAAPADQQGSAVSAVKAWTAAGMPADQIVLGVASYGHSFSVSNTAAFASGSTTQLAAYPAFNASNQPDGDSWDDTAGVDVCGVYEGVGGNFDFWGLIDGGFLNTDGTVAPDIAYRFDDCSQTAYVYNTTSEVMVSFDDARAFAAKGEYIESTGLLGFAMWEAGGDSRDILLDSIRSAGGYYA